MKNNEFRCCYSKCKIKNGEIKLYIIADDLENPKPYHPECMEELKIEIMLAIAKE